MDKLIKAKYLKWKKYPLEDGLNRELDMLNESEIIDAFFADLAFGTGGLRGVIGVGTNRMNVYTVKRASIGLAQYLLNNFREPSIAIAYDSRNKSRLFADTTAQIMAYHGIRVFIYKELMPTPALSYAVRSLSASAGIVITASHNPKQYNGYKVYGSDGCQITDHAADLIMKEIEKIDPFVILPILSLNEYLKRSQVEYISEEIIDALYHYEASLSTFKGKKDIKIVYSALNGAGFRSVTSVLKLAGYENIFPVKEQCYPDGNFPTCPKPNPELNETLELGIELAKEEKTDIFIVTDPDCDRVRTAIRHKGEFVLLNGNEIGVLLFDYLLRVRSVSNPFVIKTIVTSDMAKEIAKKNNVTLYETLTGFKYIGEQMGIREEKGDINNFLLGFEESYGYLSAKNIRDKDAINGALMIADMCAYFKSQNKDLIERMKELYEEYGWNKTCLINKEFYGQEGKETMDSFMASLREKNDFLYLNYKEDYATSKRTFINYEEEIFLPKSDVLKFSFIDGSSVAVRPSGTEPKLKLYFYIKADKDKLEEKLNFYQQMFLSFF
ncbi:MAG: phospho-sugar mutase [Bacilli bacterium]|jgi:phosphoglucomutase|nr:phospho-sugar mutase [Bacilli bacterium]